MLPLEFFLNPISPGLGVVQADTPEQVRKTSIAPQRIEEGMDFEVLQNA